MEQQSVFLYNLHFGVYEVYKNNDSVQVYKLAGSYAIVKNDDIKYYKTPGKFWLAMQSLFKKYGPFEFHRTKNFACELYEFSRQDNLCEVQCESCFWVSNSWRGCSIEKIKKS